MLAEFILVALTHADGTLGVMKFVTRGLIPRPPRPIHGAIYLSDGDDVVFLREATDEAIQAECIEGFAHHNPVVRWRIIEESELPASREYHVAWMDDGNAIVHDLPKARAIHRERIRVRRAKLFDKFDDEVRDADEALLLASENDVQARDEARRVRRKLAQKRKRLKDAPADPRIEAAQTIEELAAIDPLKEDTTPSASA